MTMAENRIQSNSTPRTQTVETKMYASHTTPKSSTILARKESPQRHYETTLIHVASKKASQD